MEDTMPRTVLEGFNDFLAKLTPSTTESDKARDHRSSIEACLKSNFGLKRFLRIGSFGNGTSVSGFSDVDYLAEIPTDQLTLSSTSSLAKVRDVLAERFKRTDVHVRCPAVVVPFGDTMTETTDVVPADNVGLYKNNILYDIPDFSGRWMNACPDLHKEYVKNIDDSLAKKARPLVRLIKAWKYYKNVNISSFYIEMRVAKYAEKEKYIQYNEDVKRILCQLRDCKLASMQDPVGGSGLIDACRSEPVLEDALSKLETAATRAEKAMNAETNGNAMDAFYWWRLLYDEEFPPYYR
jgi:hypothetical protein